jgi:5-methylcytosine-specific restriction endonuclease McrA
MRRLTWGGSLEAQRQHDEAAKRLKRKPRKPGRRKTHAPRKQPDYRKYLRGAWWRKRRLIALRRAGWCCQKCGSGIALEVHHKTYERLYAEKDSDLRVLCYSCHRGKHPDKQGSL